MEIKPITLTGKYVRLEPLSVQHLDDLTRVGLEPEIWKHMLYGDMRTKDDMRGWIEEMLRRQERGNDLPFAVIHLKDRCAVGGTRYHDIRRKDRGVAIGGTWYGLDYQRTAVNTESKYLLLRNAFEAWECVRVQIITDFRNERSQRAIERLGAVREGVLRDHMIRPNGELRSSVVYSILKDEWHEVKARLEEMLSR